VHKHPKITAILTHYLKVGKGIPEFTLVESATAAGLSKGGLRVVTQWIKNLKSFRDVNLREKNKKIQWIQRK